MNNNIDGQLQIMKSFEEKIKDTWNSPEANEFQQCLMFINDFTAWIDCLQHMPQSILFQSALNECATANLFCSQGLYKHAMISLRLCLEHCLYAIYMSSNDFYFRRWKSGQEDMRWGSIKDKNTGIFSKSFIRAYAPEFEERSTELNTIVENVYRECSEYVHGNYDKLNYLPGKAEFSEKMLSQYIKSFHSISYLLSIALVIRFKEYIVNEALLGRLEDPIMHNIGMLGEIQLLYGRDEV